MGLTSPGDLAVDLAALKSSGTAVREQASALRSSAPTAPPAGPDFQPSSGAASDAVQAYSDADAGLVSRLESTAAALTSAAVDFAAAESRGVSTKGGVAR